MISTQATYSNRIFSNRRLRQKANSGDRKWRVRFYSSLLFSPVILRGCGTSALASVERSLSITFLKSKMIVHLASPRGPRDFLLGVHLANVTLSYLTDCYLSNHSHEFRSSAGTGDFATLTVSDLLMNPAGPRDTAPTRKTRDIF